MPASCCFFLSPTSTASPPPPPSPFVAVVLRLPLPLHSTPCDPFTPALLLPPPPRPLLSSLRPRAPAVRPCRRCALHSALALLVVSTTLPSSPPRSLLLLPPFLLSPLRSPLSLRRSPPSRRRRSPHAIRGSLRSRFRLRLCRPPPVASLCRLAAFDDVRLSERPPAVSTHQHLPPVAQPPHVDSSGSGYCARPPTCPTQRWRLCSGSTRARISSPYVRAQFRPRPPADEAAHSRQPRLRVSPGVCGYAWR
ncbi:hypothetical protein C8R44DRAFT_990353 [Mycena epipterygia]|nr:hypothetical protein C8R44DRAFT_990353 [Mycena epipterygia]